MSEASINELTLAEESRTLLKLRTMQEELDVLSIELEETLDMVQARLVET